MLTWKKNNPCKQPQRIIWKSHQREGRTTCKNNRCPGERNPRKCHSGPPDSPELKKIKEIINKKQTTYVQKKNDKTWLDAILCPQQKWYRRQEPKNHKKLTATLQPESNPDTTLQIQYPQKTAYDKVEYSQLWTTRHSLTKYWRNSEHGT